MAYDGNIKINTEISVKNATSQMLSLENRIVKTANKIAELKNKMNVLSTAKIPTQEYTEIQTQIANATKEFDKLLSKQEEMQASGKTSGNAWDSIQRKLEEAGNTIRYAKGELDDLVAKGQAFTLGKDSAEYQKLNGQLNTYEREMNVLTQKHVELADKQNKTGKSGEKAFSKVNNATKKTGGLLKTLASRFKGIALSLLIFNWITRGFNAMITGIKEGVNNYVKYSDKLNKTMSDFSTATNTLKNSLGIAFAPILNVIVPALTTLINYLVTAINYFSQFAALLSGKASFTKATSQQKDYAKSLNGTAGAAKKAQGALASFDTLEVLSKQDSGGGGGADAAGGFEEVKIPSDTIKKFDDMKKAMQPVIDKIKELGNLFQKGFLAGLGSSFTDRVQNIKDNIKSIGESLQEIFTDPKVVAAADNSAKKIAYAYGQIAGSLVSIGVTIAQNLVGGIAKYLESSKDFIKQRLIGTFDAAGSAAEIVGNFFEAFAYVFEALGGENGQRVTGALIGIFTDAFLGLQEILVSLVGGILNVILTPFIENKETLKTTLDETLGVIATVLEAIKGVVDSTVSQIIAVYNQKISPFFDSLASGFSSIFAIFLNSYNQYFLPVIQGIGEKFTELMTTIQPYINNFIILIGSVIEIITILWENVLLPIIEMIVPLVVAMISDIVSQFADILFPTLEFFAELVNEVVTMAIGFFEGLATFLTGVFTGNWQLAWEGIKKIFKSVWDGMLSIVKTIVNAIIGLVNKMISSVADGLNAIIKMLNTIQIDIPSWVPGIGGKSFHINIPTVKSPQIPYLADGAVIQGGSPFLAMLGDQPSGQTNIETPLNTMIDAFKTALNSSENTTVPSALYMQMDSETVAELLIEPFLSALNRRGYNADVLLNGG